MRSGTLVLLVAAYGCTDAPSVRLQGPASVRFEVPALDGAWYKGNTHAHTTESDGDSSPEYVAQWYKDHGYDFLVLSDHNILTDPVALDHLVDSTYLLIPGEEVTTSFEAAAVHVNGLNIPGVIEARTAESLVATIQASVDAIRDVEGIPHVNHPNFLWSFGVAELLQVEDNRLLEIWNGHPLVHNEGGGGSPGLEEIWDELLTSGTRIYGIAVDDAHHFQGEFSPDRVNPGRGWIQVRAGSLDATALMEALEAGHFYASTGVELEEVVVTADRLEIAIRELGDYRYSVDFIGAAGSVLATSYSNPAVYELARDEPYVRAKVTDSGGSAAWVQPVFTTSR